MKNGRAGIWTQAHRLHHIIQFPTATSTLPHNQGTTTPRENALPQPDGTLHLCLSWFSLQLGVAFTLPFTIQIHPSRQLKYHHLLAIPLHTENPPFWIHVKCVIYFIQRCRESLSFFLNVYIIHSLIQWHIRTLSFLLKWLSTSRCQEPCRLFFFVSLKLSWYKI